MKYKLQFFGSISLRWLDSCDHPGTFNSIQEAQSRINNMTSKMVKYRICVEETASGYADEDSSVATEEQPSVNVSTSTPKVYRVEFYDVSSWSPSWNCGKEYKSVEEAESAIHKKGNIGSSYRILDNTEVVKTVGTPNRLIASVPSSVPSTPKVPAPRTLPTYTGRKFR